MVKNKLTKDREFNINTVLSNGDVNNYFSLLNS